MAELWPLGSVVDVLCSDSDEVSLYFLYILDPWVNPVASLPTNLCGEPLIILWKTTILWSSMLQFISRSLLLPSYLHVE